MDGQQQDGEPPPRVVVLSPHLDDAVLSLGAALARWSAQGRTVEVWTAFTEAPPGAGPPRRLAAFGDYARRRDEDDRALAVVGARPHHLGLPERLWREPRPRTLAGAFLGPRTAAGFAYLDGLTTVVADLLLTGAQVYAPLGIGQHVDHVELTLAALRAADRTGRRETLLFYEDFYALEERFRRRHPVAARRPTRWWRSPSWTASALVLSLGVPAAVLPARGPERYDSGIAGRAWRFAALPVEDFEARKLQAVLQYTSQVPRLGGRRGLSAAMRRSHRERGGEAVWSLAAPTQPSGRPGGG